MKRIEEMLPKLMKMCGGGDEVYGVISSFRKEANGYVHFLGARKKNQKNIHPTKPPLYGRM